MSFEGDLKVGSIGERVAWDILINLPDIRQVIDVRKDKRFQAEDVDFLIETLERQFLKVEVKADRRMGETGNIIYETDTSGNIGCMTKTKADLIYQYDTVNQIMYVIPTFFLRWFVAKRKLQEVRISGDTKGYLVSVEELKAQKIITKIYEVGK